MFFNACPIKAAWVSKASKAAIWRVSEVMTSEFVMMKKWVPVFRWNRLGHNFRLCLVYVWLSLAYVQCLVYV